MFFQSNAVLFDAINGVPSLSIDVSFTCKLVNNITITIAVMDESRRHLRLANLFANSTSSNNNNNNDDEKVGNDELSSSTASTSNHADDAERNFDPKRSFEFDALQVC